jgi:hypothetical protein
VCRVYSVCRVCGVCRVCRVFRVCGFEPKMTSFQNKGKLY